MIDSVQRGDTPIPAALIAFIRPIILYNEGREAEALALVREAFPDEIDRGLYTFYYTLAARSGDPARIARAAELLEQRMAEGKFMYVHGAFEWLELGEMERARAALVRTLEDGLDLTEVRKAIAFSTIEAPGFYQKDPRPLMATIPFIIEAYERAGIRAFEGVEPLEFGEGE